MLLVEIVVFLHEKTTFNQNFKKISCLSFFFQKGFKKKLAKNKKIIKRKTQGTIIKRTKETLAYENKLLKVYFDEVKFTNGNYNRIVESDLDGTMVLPVSEDGKIAISWPEISSTSTKMTTNTNTLKHATMKFQKKITFVTRQELPSLITAKEVFFFVKKNFNQIVLKEFPTLYLFTKSNKYLTIWFFNKNCLLRNFKQGIIGVQITLAHFFA
ncbi:hypothetical protein RFI_28601 [Reticulomyxa filosa]|uniref:Uncharacterized protein n=1 Tax=Reticulomyxa filosa TaxID=46433 RepID=X6M5P1_RETFI|nr:hypothetical protein RFI_28601 [Reticulomyxa filosa]|eukprot:ETO08787.1 hypothetical protein RFI_28601 [Reticulomyxa filosa]